MADNIDRLELDKALFASRPVDHLTDIIRSADPRLVAGGIVRMLQLAIVAEDIAAERGVTVTPDDIASYTATHYPELASALEKQITQFICSMVSQEG